MRGMRRALSEYQPGVRLALAGDNTYRPVPGLRDGRPDQIEIATITSIDGNRVNVATSKGEMSGFLACGGLGKVGHCFHVIWSEPLPEDDAAATEWARLVVGAKERPWLMLVFAVDERFVYGWPVTGHSSDPPEAFEFRVARDSHPQPASLIHGNAEIWQHPLRFARTPREAAATPDFTDTRQELDAAAGDLLLIVPGASRLVDGMPAHEPRAWSVLARGLTAETVGTWMPKPLTHSPDWTGDLGAIIHEEGRAEARSEPSEALVLFYTDPNGNAGAQVLSSSGITFYEADSLNDYMESHGVEEGLWVMREATWWSDQSFEGEWDAGIEGNWEPATLDDVKRAGFDLPALDREIAEYAEIDPVEGLALKYIEMATNAVAEPVASS